MIETIDIKKLRSELIDFENQMKHLRNSTKGNVSTEQIENLKQIRNMGLIFLIEIAIIDGFLIATTEDALSQMYSFLPLYVSFIYMLTREISVNKKYKNAIKELKTYNQMINTADKNITQIELFLDFIENTPKDEIEKYLSYKM